MYSQNNEEQIIREYFAGFVGRFLDVGAHDGISLSNSRALYEIGWSGTVVEPAPQHVLKLLGLYGADQRVTVVQAAVAGSRGLGRMMWNWEGPAYSSTLSKRKALEFCANDYTKTYMVPTVLLDDVWNGPDFLNLDTEGMEEEILLASADLISNVKLICVELCKDTKHSIPSLLKSLGFKEVAITPENLLACKP